MTIRNTVPGQLADDLYNLKLVVAVAAGWLGDIENGLDSPQALRLLRRRIGRYQIRRGAGIDSESLYNLQWLMEQSEEQLEVLTGAISVLTEPVRDPGTRYGVETGILAKAPYDWGKCGTPAAYKAHRRRGQDCQACRKAAARYQADRRRRSSTVGGPIQIRDISRISL